MMSHRSHYGLRHQYGRTTATHATVSRQEYDNNLTSPQQRLDDDDCSKKSEGTVEL